ncbi:MAG: hypothetical protein ABJN14_04370 [Paracoccaceae bacterium]
MNGWIPKFKPDRQFNDMANQRIYSRKQWVRAVNLSALFGWAISTLPLVMLTGPATLIYGVIFGLPIAFLCCWVIGAPILNRLMRHEITLGRAAFWGGLIALLFSLLWTAVERYRGWQASLDPSRSTNFSGGTGFNGGFVVTEFNGILTTYGWLMVVQSTLVFTAVGVFVAVLVRSLIGKPSAGPEES